MLAPLQRRDALQRSQRGARVPRVLVIGAMYSLASWAKAIASSAS
jgi:hypothetical protein